MKLPLLKTFYCKTFKSTTAFILFDKKTFYKKLGTKQRSNSDPAEAAVQRSSYKKVFWKHAENLLENTHAVV